MRDGLPANIYPYRLGWYAPLIGSYLDPTPGAPSTGAGRLTAERVAKAAKRYCNGTSFSTDPLLNPLMVRVDARLSNTTAPPGLIDWNANNTQNNPAAAQDLNFDGDLTDVLNPFDDWANVRLVLSRRWVSRRAWSSAGSMPSRDGPEPVGCRRGIDGYA